MDKVLPVLEIIRSNCKQFDIFHELLSIDESLIPYHSHHSARQFIRNKPIRFGYEMWMLCGADGYPYILSIYCGKDSQFEITCGDVNAAAC